MRIGFIGLGNMGGGIDLATERGADRPLLDYIRQSVIPDLRTTGMTG